MRIVLYNTNPSGFNKDAFFINTIPSWTEQWNLLSEKYPEHEFFIFTMYPGMFLCDPDGSIQPGRNIKLFILNDSRPEKVAAEILSVTPDIAISASYWTFSFDWIPLNDALIADLLRSEGIETICHSSHVSMSCFDKYETHLLLEKHGFSMPGYIYVNHELYKTYLKKYGAENNVYREYIKASLSRMHFPVIIKTTTGLSSQGIHVLKTQAEAVSFLDSKRNSGDRIIEEYRSGLHMGLEIHGTKGRYSVLPPMVFSTNSHGITSPKQCVKAGPVADASLDLDGLKREMTRLAKTLNFSGCVQVDVVYSQGQWFIIELNSRLSGMTATYSAALETSVPEMLLIDAGILKNPYPPMKYCLNIKYPLTDDHVMDRLKALPYVNAVSKYWNTEALQEREKGYCEVICGPAGTREELEDMLSKLKAATEDCSEPSFIEEAEKLLRTL